MYDVIFLGTGQRNARLDIPGKEYLHGSRKFLDIDKMPDHLICIGAGIISMEFASMALTLGKKGHLHRVRSESFGGVSGKVRCQYG